MEGMGLSFQVGMVRVEVGDFKDSCLAHPQAILRQLQYHLPNQANNKSDDLVRKIMVSTATVINGCVTNFVHIQYTICTLLPCHGTTIGEFTCNHLWDSACELYCPGPSAQMRYALNKDYAEFTFMIDTIIHTWYINHGYL